MIVSDEKKFIFVAVPKTGSSSIEKALSEYSNKELETGIIKHLHLKDIPELLDEPYYKFCFFRNPWERLVSLFHYHLRQKNTFLGYTYDKYTFAEWVKETELRGAGLKDRQTDYIIHKGRIVPNVHVYKFEEMEDSWKHICGVLGVEGELPHLNKSKHTHYSEYYTDEVKHIVKIREYGAIKMMNYKFEEK